MPVDIMFADHDGVWVRIK